MNIMEGLARELVRVAQMIPTFEGLGISGQPCLAMVRQAIECGCSAAGGGDTETILRALRDLKGFD